MKVFFITFRSVTYAQRGEQALRSAGYKCRLRRTPKWMEERGCGYGVELTAAGLGDGLRVLRQQQIPWRKTWLLHRSGEVEEVVDDLS